jgi:hypothetical protein
VPFAYMVAVVWHRLSLFSSSSKWRHRLPFIHNRSCVSRVIDSYGDHVSCPISHFVFSPSIPSRFFVSFLHQSVTFQICSRQPSTVGQSQVCSIIRGTRSNFLLLHFLQKTIVFASSLKRPFEFGVAFWCTSLTFSTFNECHSRTHPSIPHIL